MYSAWRGARSSTGSGRSMHCHHCPVYDSHCEIPRNFKLLNKFNDVRLENLKNYFGLNKK